MMIIRKLQVIFFSILISIFLLPFNLKSKTVLDVISDDKNLTIFNSYLIKTGLDRVLEKKLPWNWTIFAPSNKAFKEAPKMLKDQILDDDILSKFILMDHIMTGHKTSLDIGEEITTQITVSNKPIQIYKSEKLFVKDMVVVKENLIGNNGVIHIIDCIMFVQPSIDDDRVPVDLGKDFPITSCCMRDNNEIQIFKKAAENKY